MSSSWTNYCIENIDSVDSYTCHYDKCSNNAILYKIGRGFSKYCSHSCKCSDNNRRQYENLEYRAKTLSRLHSTRNTLERQIELDYSIIIAKTNKANCTNKCIVYVITNSTIKDNKFKIGFSRNIKYCKIRLYQQKHTNKNYLFEGTNYATANAEREIKRKYMIDSEWIDNIHLESTLQDLFTNDNLTLIQN